MKNITKLNYKLLAIFMAIIFAVLIFASIPAIDNKYENTPAKSALCAGDSMTAENHYGLYNTLGTAKNKVEENIKDYLVANNNADRSKINITSSTYSAGLLFDVPNFSQSNLNAMYHSENGVEYDGTCSIVAMAEILTAVDSLSDEFNYDGTTYDLFSTLLNISEFWGNNYVGNDVGTSRASIPLILSTFLIGVQPGFSVDFYGYGSHYNNGDNSFSSIAELNGYDVVPLSILSLSRYDKEKAHSVAVSGSYTFSVSYSYKTRTGWNKYFAKSGSKQFVVFVVCNGWYDSNLGSFGATSNYQYLVMDYDIDFNIVTFNWDEFVPGIDF